MPTLPILLCMAWCCCMNVHLCVSSCNYHVVGIGHSECQSMCSYFFPCFIKYEAESLLGSFITTQLDKKLSFYEYCLFIAMFMWVHHWSVFWPSWIYCLSLRPFYWYPLKYSLIYTCICKVVSSLWVLDWNFLSFPISSFFMLYVLPISTLIFNEEHN
jgi:hypothetical protein